MDRNTPLARVRTRVIFIVLFVLIGTTLIACSSNSSSEPTSNAGPVFVSPKDSDRNNVDTPENPNDDAKLPTPTLKPEAISAGFEMFGDLGCVACHSVSGRADAVGQAGPNLDNIGDTAHVRVPGMDAAAYLHQSITDPAAFVAPGFVNVMPAFDQLAGTPRLDELIAYLLTLSSPDREDYLGISDSLIGKSGTATGTTPEFGPAGEDWVSESGIWSFGNSGLSETSGAAVDNRLLVDSGLDHASYSVDVQWNGGLAGVVGRYSDSRNWIMAWYAPDGVIAVGTHSEEGFVGHKGTKFDWGDVGDTHQLMIADYGDIVDVLVDGERIFSFDPSPILASGRGGLFSRTHSSNVFTNFSITPPGDRPKDEFDVEQDSAENPQVVVPPDPALAPNFVESLRELRKKPRLMGTLLAEGHTLELVADSGLAHPISITFGNGALYVVSSELDDLDKGAIYALKQLPYGGFGPPILVAVGLKRSTGILYAHGSIFATSRGAVTRLTDTDGDFVADIAEQIVSGLPLGNPGIKGQSSVHQTHGLRLGSDGRIYVMQGSISDRGPHVYPLEGTVFSILPDGSDLQIYATGFRNPMEFDFNHRGDAFTIDNGADLFEDAPTDEWGQYPSDELHFIRPGADHGFPDILGDPPENPTESPLRMWFPQIAPGGMEFYDGGTFPGLTEDDLLFVKWNKQIISRIRIELIDGEYQVTDEEELIAGFGTLPTDVTVSPNGDIYIADWTGGRIFRIRPQPAK